jgi:hypothetical protein
MSPPRQLRSARHPRRTNRPILETLPVLDARMLARERLFPPNWADRHTYDDFGLVLPQIRTLTLTRRSANIIHRSGQQQTIPIRWNAIRGIVRSQRPAFVCTCGRRSFCLYFAKGRFCCHACTGAIYASQACYSAHRPCLQSIRLRRFLGAWLTRTVPPRPPLMRKRTYNRLIQQLHQLEAKMPRKWRSHRLSDRILLPLTLYATQLETRRP